MPDNINIGNDWTITGIPSELMQEFALAAKEIYPDEKDAWMHFIIDTISSVCSMDRAVYQMTDIPSEAMIKFDEAVEQCKYNRYSIFSELLQDAQQNNLAVGRMHSKESEPGKSIGLIITGIPVKSWEGMEEVAKEWKRQTPQIWKNQEPTAAGVIMIFLELALVSGFTFQFTPITPEAKAAAEAATNGTKPKSKSGSSARGRFKSD